MEKSQNQSREMVCSVEALDLLNCVTETPYDQEKCLRLLNALRNCVLNKIISNCASNSEKWHFLQLQWI
ncbi:hypothetical protein ACHQM5_000345 [Ranunculus cassubicifolius]